VLPVLIITLLAFQDRPAIQEVQSMTGRLARSGCWLPLKVRLASPAPFEGELTATGDTGIRVTRPVRIPAGGIVAVILPVVAVGSGAKVEVILRGPSGEVDRRPLIGPLEFLGDARLVLVDPAHPEAESLQRQKLTVQEKGPPVLFVPSDPVDWNEAADMGALEIVDAVVASDRWRPDLTMTVWRALGGALVTQPRRDLLARLAEPTARFPAVDPQIAPYVVTERWIPGKRESAMLFIVVYAFAFFVAVYVTWARKGSPWLLTAAAIAAAIVFVAAYGAFFPKGNLAIKAWQGLVEAPESPVAISVCAIWGSEPAGEVEFGRIVKPVHATIAEATIRDLELRLGEGGRWKVRGAAPGAPTRFVVVERLQQLTPWKPYLDAQGNAMRYRPTESEFFQKVPRKAEIRLQAPEEAAALPARAPCLVDTTFARVFRIKVRT
jgi:hypothetical protein